MDINYCIWLMLCTSGVMGQFQVDPLVATVLTGSDAQFTAKVQGTWAIMTWTVQGFLVLTVPRSGNISSSSEQFSASFCSSVDTGCVAFTIHNTTRAEAGPVTCTIQGDYGSKTVQLQVQESGTVQIKEGNMTVVQDQEVEIHCETSAWFPIPEIRWTLNGDTMDSGPTNSTNVTHGDSFNSSSVLKFQAVKDSTLVCWATLQTLTNPLASSVHVLVVPKPPDRTVLIAVVCSFGGLALLALLILGIMFCYKRRKEKESNYQDEMTKRVRTQSQLSGLRPPGQKQGAVNAGYVKDGQTSVATSDQSDSGYFQRTRSNIFEMPNSACNNQTENGYKSTYNGVDDDLTKHRHATIV
ncbi:immunoglobulin superfamily member 5 isoform X2 [Entelurus aequoreus]|uniref:immunoglobulin superfamily member 5 isoform X2 n=1 Tax=Entelurus aequoreus TaxID=161455 RepID=UPI002B1E807C|nr:immunoglobulin superfamily member 5 isoform X2 [Entelurus aequoreus]